MKTLTAMVKGLVLASTSLTSLAVPAEGERLVVNCLVEDDAVRFQDRDGVALHLGGFSPAKLRLWLQHLPELSFRQRSRDQVTLEQVAAIAA